MTDGNAFWFHYLDGFTWIDAAAWEKEPQVGLAECGAKLLFSSPSRVAGVVDYEGVILNFKCSCKIGQVSVVVYERSANFDIFKLECFFLACVPADIFLEVRPVIVEKI